MGLLSFYNLTLPHLEHVLKFCPSELKEQIILCKRYFNQIKTHKYCLGIRFWTEFLVVIPYEKQRSQLNSLMSPERSGGARKENDLKRR
jgi:hypothetical protein